MEDVGKRRHRVQARSSRIAVGESGVPIGTAELCLFGANKRGALPRIQVATCGYAPCMVFPGAYCINGHPKTNSNDLRISRDSLYAFASGRRFTL